MTAPLIGGRFDIVDVDEILVGETEFVSAELDVKPLILCLNGQQVGEEIDIRGISPGYVAIGPQADPEIPTNVAIDANRDFFGRAITLSRPFNDAQYFRVIDTDTDVCILEITKRGLIKLYDTGGSQQAIVSDTEVGVTATTRCVVTALGLEIANINVIGPQNAAIADPAGGGVVDAECRTAVIAILEHLRGTVNGGSQIATV